jgi:hypothetical protein
MTRIRYTSPRSLLFAIAGLLLLEGGAAMAIESPDYEVVETYPRFELRRYPPYLVAQTEVTGTFEEVGGKGFRILADFIFGNNRSREKIDMTAPVTQAPEPGGGEKIAMTAPVSQQPATEADTYVVSFVMPSRYTRQTLPEPVDARIEIRERPARLMAVRQYSGRWTEANYLKNEQTLLEAIEEAGLIPIGRPVYARYNSPFSLWFLRRNEVMVEVRRPSP